MAIDFGAFGGGFGGGGGSSLSGMNPFSGGGWGGAVQKGYNTGSLRGLTPQFQANGWGPTNPIPSQNFAAGNPWTQTGIGNWLGNLFGKGYGGQMAYGQPQAMSYDAQPHYASAPAYSAPTPKPSPYGGGGGMMQVSPMPQPKGYGMSVGAYPMAAPRPAPAPFRGDGLGLAGLRYGQTTPGAAQATGAGQSYGNYMEDAMKALFARR